MKKLEFYFNFGEITFFIFICRFKNLLSNLNLSNIPSKQMTKKSNFYSPQMKLDETGFWKKLFFQKKPVYPVKIKLKKSVLLRKVSFKKHVFRFFEKLYFKWKRLKIIFWKNNVYCHKKLYFKIFLVFSIYNSDLIKNKWI